jgi:recombinational DNA repair protein (RecF pathway)
MLTTKQVLEKEGVTRGLVLLGLGSCNHCGRMGSEFYVVPNVNGRFCLECILLSVITKQNNAIAELKDELKAVYELQAGEDL